MRLVRAGAPGNEKPAVLDGDELVDVSAEVTDFDEKFFGADGLADLSNIVRRAPRARRAGERLGPPVARPSKIVCVGLNYFEHARESGAQAPAEPVLFLKATTAINGPFDEVRLPPGSTKTDYEVELALVIGKTARRVSEERAAEHIAGYLLFNDYSEREWQLEHSGQWVKGKSFDTFAPLGPWLVTPDEVGDPHQLKMWLKVNGELRQSASTADMIFKVPHLVSYISSCMTLLPGDVISTGTPAGVAMGRDPGAFLRVGDVVELGIERLGEAKQHIAV